MPFLLPLLESGQCKSLLVSFENNDSVVNNLIRKGSGVNWNLVCTKPVDSVFLML